MKVMVREININLNTISYYQIHINIQDSHIHLHKNVFSQYINWHCDVNY